MVFFEKNTCLFLLLLLFSEERVYSETSFLAYNLNILNCKIFNLLSVKWREVSLKTYD